MAAKTIPVRGHGQITIPKRLREQFALEEGDLLEVEIAPEGILLKPRKLIDPSQAWFWTKAWQEKEREADEAIRAGRVKRFKNPDELIRDLHSHKRR
ncbi:AbrB/MazE/SpoVT family DNA-binding domain-containing protein [Candidatus Acetothermia bacterium]|jgi:AbrB family looped-hinge helix DNA binding protein|nr:AbrB/MazE/SpoVT family DNA-binding domain-containing protein [Candidatus Acetothermia bacterium]MCI2432301.1 AbrB/MazE/SpoVT family DNA-binding domain-containing protein [Candidatus Acetothermia bacterium]MCI2437426.1 AbrB/MazE/SpoVT family DNA-binding domain-containing protein [Candidatus Acetothermia bacterium]